MRQLVMPHRTGPGRVGRTGPTRSSPGQGWNHRQAAGRGPLRPRLSDDRSRDLPRPVRGGPRGGGRSGRGGYSEIVHSEESASESPCRSNPRVGPARHVSGARSRRANACRASAEGGVRVRVGRRVQRWSGGRPAGRCQPPTTSWCPCRSPCPTRCSAPSPTMSSTPTGPCRHPAVGTARSRGCSSSGGWLPRSAFTPWPGPSP